MTISTNLINATATVAGHQSGWLALLAALGLLPGILPSFLSWLTAEQASRRQFRLDKDASDSVNSEQRLELAYIRRGGQPRYICQAGRQPVPAQRESAHRAEGMAAREGEQRVP